MKLKRWLMFFLLTGLILIFTGPAPFAQTRGGTFNFVAPYDGSILTLDPHKTAKQQDLLVTTNIFRTLYQWSPEESRPVLELAKSVSVSPDGLVHTYTLHDNIYFHNNRKLTSDDIIYTFERILTMKPVCPSIRPIRIIKGAEALEKGEAQHLAGIKKISDTVFSITLKELADPAYHFYRPGTAIVPKDVVEEKGENFGIEPVGCGPFKFVKWVKGSEITVERFDRFFKEGKPFLDKVNFKIMAEGAVRDIAFRSKELDATLVEASQYRQYKNDPLFGKHLVETAEMFTRLICLNPKYEPFKNKKVRQAITLAINEDVINRKFLKGKAYNPVGWLPTTSQAFDTGAKGLGYDVARARKLMKEAGYEAGFEFKILGTTNKSYGVSVAEALGPFLEKINVKVSIQQLEGGILYDRLVNDDYQGIIWSFGSGPDPYRAMKRWHSATSNASGNYVHYQNAQYDALLDQALETRNPTAKMDLLRRADRIFTDDAAVWIFNYNKAVMAVQPWVHGIKPVAIEMMYQDLGDVWVEAPSPRL